MGYRKQKVTIENIYISIFIYEAEITLNIYIRKDMVLYNSVSIPNSRDYNLCSNVYLTKALMIYDAMLDMYSK
jgi:hypothetical protein